MTSETRDPRLSALLDDLAATGTVVLVPSVGLIQKLEEELEVARGALKELDELMTREIKRVEGRYAMKAEPVETLIEELEREIREAKRDKKSKKSRSTGRSGGRRFGSSTGMKA